MATKQPYKTTFDPAHVIRPIFTGGAVSIDTGATVLATSLGDDAILTDPSNGRHLAKIEGDSEAISTLILTPSGSHIIICSRALSLRIYALKRQLDQDDTTLTATLVRSLKPHGTPVAAIAVDRTGTLVATGGTDGTIKVWDIAGGYATHTFHGPSGLVTALHFFDTTVHGKPQITKRGKGNKRKGGNGDNGNGNGNDDDDDDDDKDATSTTYFRLVSGSQEGQIRVWDLQKRASVANLTSHVSEVKGIDYSPEQNTIVTASRDKTIIWWDAKSWKVRRVVPCLELTEAVGFADEGRITYSAGARGNLRFWDTDTGRELTPEKPACTAEGEAITAAIYRPGLPFIVCVQVDHTLALYQVPQLDTAKSTQLLRRICGTHDEIIDLQYVMPDRSVMALATNTEEIRLVSLKDASSTEDNGEPGYFGQDVGVLRGHDDIIITIDVDWSGHWLATGAKDNTAKLWRIDTTTGRDHQDSHATTCYATFSGHAESIGAVALPKTIPPESSHARTDPLNHPPAFLITGSQDQTIKKWEVPMPEKQTAVAAGAAGGLRAAFTRKAHDKDINALDVHHSGQLFASASQDKTVKIWSTAEGEVQGILRGHKRGVWSVKFSPHNLPTIQGDSGPVAGKGVILTGSGDKTIKIFSLSDYTCVRTFEGHTNNVLKVAWLKVPEQDQRKRFVQFASAGGDGLVKVWDANSGEAECTLDNHEDRVWALAVHPHTNTIVSGSSDSTVTFWKDSSVETQAAASQAASRLVEQEQELENYIRTDSYREAITLALQLNHPARLLSIFTSVVTTASPEAGSLTGVQAVDEVLATLSDEQLFLLLLRLRDWNTNARTAPVAQRVLLALVRSYPAARLSGLAAKGRKGQKSVQEVLNALKVYTERHYRRMEELVDESYLVEYTLREMDALAPPPLGVIEGPGPNDVFDIDIDIEDDDEAEQDEDEDEEMEG